MGIIGRPDGLAGDGAVEAETSFVVTRRIVQPDIRGRITESDEESLAIFGKTGTEVNALIANIAKVCAGAFDPLETGQGHGRAGLVHEIVGEFRCGDSSMPDAKVDHDVI